MLALRILLDVDRWDRASDAAQDAAIALVARRVPAFRHLRTERFTAAQARIRRDECPACHGYGGTSPQSGSTDYPDCDVCGNLHVLETPFASEPLSHRVAIFVHAASNFELALVPGRIEIPPLLVGRTAYAGAPPDGLHLATARELRHAYLRAGTFSLTWEHGTWDAHPFGLAAGAGRLAYSLPALAAMQAAAFHELVDEVGPVDPAPVAGSRVVLGAGTADPPRDLGAIAWSPDGRWIATGSSDGDLRVWDASTGRQSARMQLAVPAPVATLSFSPDSVRLAAASHADLELFELATGEALARHGVGLPPATMTPYYNQHRAAVWAPDGRLLVVEATLEGRRAVLSRIDPDTGITGELIAWTFPSYLYSVSIAVSPDGAHVAAVPGDEAGIAVRRLPSLASVAHVPHDRAGAIAFADRRLIVNARDRVLAYDLATAAPMELGSSRSSSLVASPDGARIAFPPWDGIGVYDLATRTLASCSSIATAPCAFSPDGRRIATAVEGRTIAAIWSVPSGR